MRVGVSNRWIRAVAFGLLVGLLPETWATLPDDLYLEDSPRNTGFGESLAGLGDVNGDGFDDFAVAAPRVKLAEGGEGEVRVFWGGAHGVLREPNQILHAPVPTKGYGLRVTGGDLNRDGFGDLLVLGLPPRGSNTVDLALWVYFGTREGLHSAAHVAYQGAVDGNVEGFGVIGDVNGDGLPDFAVGTPSAHLGVGEVLVFHGNLECRWASPDARIGSPRDGKYFGFFGVSRADFNRDGYDDLLVGSNHYHQWAEHNGRVQLFLGSKAGLQPQASWAATFPFPARPGIDESGYQYFGNAIVTGDFNRDGFADAVITAPFAEQNDRNEGIAFGFYGTPTGLPTAFDWTVQANRSHALLGLMAEPAGDVNGDGFPDLLLGAPDFQNNQLREGMVALFLGSPRGFAQEPGWTLESQSNHARLGTFGTGAGDLNGDGFGDFVVAQFGPYGLDNPHGAIRVIYGSATGPRGSTEITLSKPVLQWTAEEWWRLSLSGKMGLGVLGLGLVGLAGLAGRRYWVRRTIILVQQRERSSRSEERARLSRDLHDEVGAQLSRLSLAVELVRRDAEDPARTRTLTQTLSTTARDLRMAVQGLTSSLQPEAGDLGGLVEFIGRQADQFLVPLGIRCFHDAPVSALEETLLPEVRQELTACLREGLSNIIRHSGATEVWIRISCQPTVLRVGLEDNGTGFLPQEIRRGNGLRHFQERMAKVGGSVMVDSQPGMGTTVEFEVPLGKEPSHIRRD